MATNQKVGGSNPSRHAKNNRITEGSAVVFYLYGIRTLRGHGEKSKRAGDTFAEDVVRSPVPKCKAFGWTSREGAKRMYPSRHAKNNRITEGSAVVF